MVEPAQEGTLFLDEIGDLPLEAQAKLLRLLQEQEFERVGGTETLTADVRVVAATNRNLEQMVAEDTFRQDLLYRIQVAPVRLPLLRERQEDILRLADYFARKRAAHLGQKVVPTFSMEAKAVLQAYDWPGNVRQLKNVVDLAVVICIGSVIRDQDLFLNSESIAPPPAEEILPLEEVERRHIRAALEETNGVVKGPQGAAARLGLHPSTLSNKMKKLGITRP